MSSPISVCHLQYIISMYDKNVQYKITVISLYNLMSIKEVKARNVKKYIYIAFYINPNNYNFWCSSFFPVNLSPCLE